MKIVHVAAVILTLALPSTVHAAVAGDLLTMSRMSAPETAYMPYRYVGAPVVTEGKVVLGEVVIRQKAAFVRTGVLKTAVTARGGRTLAAGTPMVLLDASPDPVWCVLPGAYKTAVCLVRKEGRDDWNEFRGKFDDWPAYLGMPIRRSYPASAVVVEDQALPYPAEFMTEVVYLANHDGGLTFIQRSVGLGELSFEGKNARLGLAHRRGFTRDIEPEFRGAGGVGVTLTRNADGSLTARQLSANP